MPKRKSRFRKKLQTYQRKRRVRRLREFNFEIDAHIAKEVWAVVYLTAAFLTYFSIKGSLGTVGAVWKAALAPIFGYGIYGLPVLFLGISLTLFLAKEVLFNFSRVLGLILLIISSLSIIHLSVPLENFYEAGAIGKFGGLIGFVGSFMAISVFGLQGAYIVTLALFLISFLLTFQISLIRILSVFSPFKSRESRSFTRTISQGLEKKKLDIITPELPERTKIAEESMQTDSQPEVECELEESPSKKDSIADFKLEDLVEMAWEFPPMDLLSGASLATKADEKTLQRNAQIIKDKLHQFGIEVTMNSVNVGPTVMQYTLKPHPGVKLSKITNLKNDLALALAAKAIRIEAPIPGQSMVGIEIPNDSRSTVRLRELMEMKEYKDMDSPLKLPIGRDVAGMPIISSLAQMPHLLIAGATGSGKSVCVNSFLISLLYQYSPKDLKMILIDPKRVELNTYNGIPHLLTPVITEPEKATIALRWCVREMNERYKLCADTGHRNFTDYNTDKEMKRKIPYVLVVVDELADLMMSSGKEVEASICRIAQMARAVGIHLIVATQRPSVDVLTGLIKANIPARIAFSVASQIDSRTILDMMGAEDLLGYGDMLFMPGNTNKPIRVQGTFVSSKEIERVANRVKLTMTADYNEEIISDEIAGEKVQGIPDSRLISESAVDEDEMYESAVRLVLESRKASASLLQRRLSVGYARAARLLDLMEENGIIGPVRGAKARDILVSTE